MTPTAYAATVVRRWRWALLGGLVGAVLGLGLTPASSYETATELYVGMARVGAQEDAAYAALLRSQVLPSLVELAGSPSADPAMGSTSARAELVEDTSVLRVTVAAPTAELAAARADAAADAVRDRTATAYRDADGDPLLTVATVVPGSPPSAPASRSRVTSGVLGLAAGAALAALAAGLAEAARPRVHTAADVPGAPVLAELGSRRRTAASRAVRLDRLRHLLGGTDPGRFRAITLTGAPACRETLARELSAGGRVRVVVDDGAGTARPDGVVVVAEAGRTTVQRMVADLGVARDGGLPVLGVVLDGTGRGGPLAGWLAAAGRIGAGRPSASPTVWCALLALVAVGADVRLPLATTSGLLVTTLLAPVWVPVLPRYRGAVALAVLTVLGLASGLLLARWSTVDHAFAPLEGAVTAFAVLTGLGTVGLLLWARTVLPLRPLGVAFGAGMLVHGLLRVPQSDNPFKFELSLPLTVIVLALVMDRRRPWVSAAALGVLGALNVLSDARSAFAFCLAAAALILWQARPGGSGRSVRWGRGVLLLGTVAAAGYALLTELLLSGALGAGLQERTATQVAQSGSLLVSGRPEWTATWALMQSRPQGFGLGTVPSPADVQVAEAGLAVVNDPTAEGYLHNYLLAGRFELHSVVADLWSNLGPAGLVLGLAMAALLGTAASTLLARRHLSGLVCFLVPTALWYLAFGPLPTDLDVISLALGLALLPRTGTDVPSPEHGSAVPDRGPVREQPPPRTTVAVPAR